MTVSRSCARRARTFQNTHLDLGSSRPAVHIRPPDGKWLIVKVVLKETNKANLVGQVCAVCLEDFRVKEELGLCPCTHAFHTKCLMKWLEVRNSCPMCNKTISVPLPRHSLEHM